MSLSLNSTAGKVSRRLFAAAGAALLLTGLASCGGGDEKKASGATPSEITFSILSAEGQASSGPLWQPLLDDMSKAIGVPVKPMIATAAPMRRERSQTVWSRRSRAAEPVSPTTTRPSASTESMPSARRRQRWYQAMPSRKPPPTA